MIELTLREICAFSEALRVFRSQFHSLVVPGLEPEMMERKELEALQDKLDGMWLRLSDFPLLCMTPREKSLVADGDFIFDGNKWVPKTRRT